MSWSDHLMIGDRLPLPHWPLHRKFAVPPPPWSVHIWTSSWVVQVEIPLLLSFLLWTLSHPRWSCIHIIISTYMRLIHITIQTIDHRSSKSVTDELKSSKRGQSSSKRWESSPKRGQSSSKRKKSSFAKKKVSAKTSPLQREAGRKRKAASGKRNQKRSTMKRRKSSSKGRKITKSSERAKKLSKKRKRRGNTKSGQAEDVEESKKRSRLKNYKNILQQ